MIEEPAQRYSAIARLLGIELLEDRELTVKGVRDTLQGHAQSAALALSGLEAEIRVASQLDSSATDVDLLSKINEIRARNNLPPCDALEQLSGSGPPVAPGVSPPGSAAAEKVGLARGLLPASDRLQALTDRLGSLTEGAGILGTKISVGEYALTSFLRDGVGFLEESDEELCPFCGQSVNKTDLLQTVRDRISRTLLLSDEASSIRREASALGEELANLCTNLQGAVAYLSVVEDFGGVPPDFVNLVSKALEFRVGLSAQPLPRFGTAEEHFADHLRVLSERVAALLAACDQWLQANRTRALEGVLNLQHLSTLAQRLLQARRDARGAQASREVAVKLFDHLTTVRKEVVTGIYAEIRTDLMSFYGALHPGEDPESISLEVDERRRASARLVMTSFGHPESDPRAYASEAHLDTLGLCIFLAFARRFQSDFPLLVLDDVLTTVDGQHRLRVAGLLSSEFSSKQLIITTHDQVWFKELHEQFRSDRGDFHFIEFEKWNLETGPSLKDYKPRWDELEELFGDGTPLPLVANACRQHLEWVLGKMCSTTKASLPFSADGHYGLGDLFAGARTRLDSLIRDPEPKRRFEQAFADVSRTAFMGNLLSHANPMSGMLTRSELEAFAQSVRSLELAFSCDNSNHHSLLVYSRDLKELSCPMPSCDARTRFTTR
ncbi:MAG: hypothetical protein WAN74_02180 [Thermoplasmata archaeon]